MKQTPGIELRPLKFPFNTDITTWYRGDRDISLFFNTLSIFFPEGEKFFIESVNRYRDRITDPKLREEVRLFAGQEGLHRREHERYNEALTAAGLPADKLGEEVVENLNFTRRMVPARRRLAITCALEHFTAILADALLSDECMLDGADPGIAAIWKWHAIEETEHKAVAFDVYQQVGGNWLERCFTMFMVTMSFSFHIWLFMFRIMRSQGRAFNPIPWLRMGWWIWGSPGPGRRVIRNYFGYYRPGFHPWDQDNRRHIEKFRNAYPEFLRQVEQAST